jgi:hypothetical protein
MALRESVAATVAILESLEAQALSAFLPPGRYALHPKMDSHIVTPTNGQLVSAA